MNRHRGYKKNFKFNSAEHEICPAYKSQIPNFFLLNVTVEKMEITFFPNLELNPVHWTQSPTLYHITIKAGLYHKAVQVYHIPIPGNILTLH